MHRLSVYRCVRWRLCCLLLLSAFLFFIFLSNCVRTNRQFGGSHSGVVVFWRLWVLTVLSVCSTGSHRWPDRERGGRRWRFQRWLHLRDPRPKLLPLSNNNNNNNIYGVDILLTGDTLTLMHSIIKYLMLPLSANCCHKWRSFMCQQKLQRGNRFMTQESEWKRQSGE